MSTFAFHSSLLILYALVPDQVIPHTTVLLPYFLIPSKKTTNENGSRWWWHKAFEAAPPLSGYGAAQFCGVASRVHLISALSRLREKRMIGQQMPEPFSFSFPSFLFQSIRPFKLTLSHFPPPPTPTLSFGRPFRCRACAARIGLAFPKIGRKKVIGKSIFQK